MAKKQRKVMKCGTEENFYDEGFSVINDKGNKTIRNGSLTDANNPR